MSGCTLRLRVLHGIMPWNGLHPIDRFRVSKGENAVQFLSDRLAFASKPGSIVHARLKICIAITTAYFLQL